MRFVQILSRITSQPWMIMEESLENIAALIEARIGGLATAESSFVRDSGPRTEKATALIPIYGVIGKRLSSMEMECGGCDIDAVESAFDEANHDPKVGRIVMHIDSPGGTVTGVPELAQKIYREKRKPMMAVSDTLMASAAYYLASAADEIVVTPTANVGSIGVVLHVRETLNAESADGRTRLRIFRSGVDKAIGGDAPLSDAQAAMLQERVDQLGTMFRNDVIKSRPSVQPDSMTGIVYHGEEGVRRKLADRVVRSLAEALR